MARLYLASSWMLGYTNAICEDKSIGKGRVLGLFPKQISVLTGRNVMKQFSPRYGL